MSCLLLAYSAYAVPMQLSIWNNDDPCNPFPTLYIDLFVDSFFMVRAWEMLLLLLLLLNPPSSSCSPTAPPNIHTGVTSR